MTHHILRIFTAFALTGIFALSSHGATPEEARQAYDKGDYTKAVEIYQELAKTHGTSSALLFDMGQAYTRAGDLGHGMLCYRRALQQNPSNSQARSNIKYIESRVQDGNTAELKGKKISVVPEDPSFFTVLKNYITRRHHTNTPSHAPQDRIFRCDSHDLDQCADTDIRIHGSPRLRQTE